MAYRFAIQKVSYIDYASGLVIRSAPGRTAFPVRLAREMFEQCRAFLRSAEPSRNRWAVYDPCCGAGFLVTCVGLMYGDQLVFLAASDVDPRSTALAQQNLQLLTRTGASRRAEELEAMFRLHGNPAHERALESARALQRQIVEPPPETRVFAADARDAVTVKAQMRDVRPDIVLTDVPYGRGEKWTDTSGEPISPEKAMTEMLDALRTAVAPSAIIAIASDSHLKITHPAFDRLRQFKIGKRRLTWLTRRHGSGA